MNEKVKKLDLGNFGYRLAGFIAWLAGWDIQGVHPGIEKCVFIACPHRSNWDLLWMMLVSLRLRLPVYFMMKDTAFWGPFGALWRYLGGIPVNRKRPIDLVDSMVAEFRAHDHMFLVIAPSGTRKPVKYLKSGFYRIAWEAQVPICMAYINYPGKFTGVGDTLYPTGDYAADFAKIKAFYTAKVGYEPDYDPDRMPKLTPSQDDTRPD